jgi:hypothetical protein
MATDALFPEFASQFNHTDGFTYNVPCFIPGERDVVLEAAECIAGFLPPTDERSIRNCVRYLLLSRTWVCYPP